MAICMCVCVCARARPRWNLTRLKWSSTTELSSPTQTSSTTPIGRGSTLLVLLTAQFWTATSILWQSLFRRSSTTSSLPSMLETSFNIRIWFNPGRKYIYPPPPPLFGHKAFFWGGGAAVFGVYFFEAPPAAEMFFCRRKGLTNPKIARMARKDFLNDSRGLPGQYPVKEGFEANRTRKFTRESGKIFVTWFLCSAFSVPSFLYHRGQKSGEKKTNKHKQIRGIVPEMGGGQIV